jgi:hypothetical protein
MDLTDFGTFCKLPSFRRVDRQVFWNGFYQVEKIEHSFNNRAVISTQIFRCNLSRDMTDSLNRESRQIYTGVLVQQYRILRHSEHWQHFARGKGKTE